MLDIVRGVNKKVVEILNTDSDYFERAILFLKDAGQESNDGDLRRQAGSFIETLLQKKNERRPKVKPNEGRVYAFVKFIATAAFGALVAAIWIVMINT